MQLQGEIGNEWVYVLNGECDEMKCGWSTSCQDPCKTGKVLVHWKVATGAPQLFMVQCQLSSFKCFWPMHSQLRCSALVLQQLLISMSVYWLVSPAWNEWLPNQASHLVLHPVNLHLPFPSDCQIKWMCAMVQESSPWWCCCKCLFVHLLVPVLHSQSTFLVKIRFYLEMQIIWALALFHMVATWIERLVDQHYCWFYQQNSQTQDLVHFK